MIVAAFTAMMLSFGQQASAPIPAPAATPAGVASANGNRPAPPAAEEEICRRQPIPGSRRSERVCHTKADWDRIRENARNNRDTASRDQRGGG